MKQSSKKKIKMLIGLTVVCVLALGATVAYKTTMATNIPFRNSMMFSRTNPVDFLYMNINEDVTAHPDNFHYLIDKSQGEDLLLGNYVIPDNNSISNEILKNFFSNNTEGILAQTPIKYEPSSHKIIKDFLKQFKWTDEQYKTVYIETLKAISYNSSKNIYSDNTTYADKYFFSYRFNEESLYKSLLASLDYMYKNENYKAKVVSSGAFTTNSELEAKVKELYKLVKAASEKADSSKKYKYNIILTAAGDIESTEFIYESKEENYGIKFSKAYEENKPIIYYNVSQFENDIINIKLTCSPSSDNKTCYGFGNIKVFDEDFKEKETYDFDFQDYVAITYLF